MKRLICIIIVIFSILSLYACANSQDEISYLRIHIRANSNSDEDQNVKYGVKDIVVTYLTPFVKDCVSIDQVKEIINEHHDNVVTLVSNYLYENGFEYGCTMNINNEFFPTRTYGDVTLESNYYDAIIINLGSGQGNNWWCVVYPPLCFSGQNIVYKSKIVELIKKYL